MKIEIAENDSVRQLTVFMDETGRNHLHKVAMQFATQGIAIGFRESRPPLGDNPDYVVYLDVPEASAAEFIAVLSFYACASGASPATPRPE
jgi:hypothetical protein